MKNDSPQPRAEKLLRLKAFGNPSVRRAIRGALLALLLWAVWSLTAILLRAPQHVVVTLGEPSPRNVKAPRQITYISDVKTQEARLAAAREVPEVYTGADRAISRQQIETLLDTTEEISSVRDDASSDVVPKVEKLKQSVDLPLPAGIYDDILALTRVEWRGVVTESLRVLDLVMREEIRPTQLADARRSAQRLISHTLSPKQYDVALALVQALVVSNSRYDAEQTIANRREAQSGVAPVHWVIREGESVLREGEIVTPLALEKLQVLGLRDEGLDWQSAVSSSLVYMVMVVALSLYVWRSNSRLLERPRREWLLIFVLVVVGISARLLVPGRTLAPYLFPAAAAAMVVALLLDVQLAMLVSVVSALLVTFNSSQGVELAVYTLLGSLISALIVWRMDQIGAFVRAMVYLALTNVSVLVGMRLGSENYDVVGLVQLVGAGGINAVLSCSLAFVAYSFIGRAFGIATSLQLLELARPNHPLFRQLLINAPGTYHHSIVISNMAERAAEAIGADALLARVGSYYHDIGKTVRPYFYAENQSDVENPHHKLDPKTSADIVIAHTTEGLALARKYRVPERVCDFIPEHHGTTLVTYFFRMASQESDGDVREQDFRYPGPRPQSKETAIVMLADSIEAWVRANRPATQADMERVIRQVINDRLISGQMDECDLTLKDLDLIREAFTSVLQGIFHPRIQYPDRVTRTGARRNTQDSHEA